MHRLLEEAIMWLKSLQKAPPANVDVPPVLEELLSQFSSLTSSTQRLAACRKENEKTLATARLTVEQRLQEVISATSCHPRDVGEDMLAQKRGVLEGWLARKEDLAKNAVEKLEAQHSEIRHVFEDKIEEAIRLAYGEWKSTAPTLCLDDDDLLRELDADLEAALNASQPQREFLPEKPMGPEAAAEGATSSTSPTPGAPVLQNPPEKPDGSTPTVAVETPLQSEAVKSGAATTEGDRKVKHQIIVPKGVGIPVIQKKVNIFDPAICKGLDWNDPETGKSSGEKPDDSMPKAASPCTALVPSPAATPSATPALERRASAIQREFRRQDTTDLDQAELDKIKVIIDGKTMYKHKGKLETWEEREARLLHNSYMKFYRSFQGPGLMAK
jgi:chaperonin cofactor prefoldin